MVCPRIGGEEQYPEHDDERDGKNDEHIPRNARAQVLRLHRAAVHGDVVILQNGADAVDDGVRFHLVIARFEENFVQRVAVLIRTFVRRVEHDRAHARNLQNIGLNGARIALRHVSDHQLRRADAAEFLLHFVEGYDGGCLPVEVLGHVVVRFHEGDHCGAGDDQREKDARKNIAVSDDKLCNSLHCRLLISLYRNEITYLYYIARGAGGKAVGRK